MCHYNYTYYYLFDEKCTSFNRMYNLLSEIWKFKDYEFLSQVASAEDRLPSVLAAVDCVINGTIASNETLLITILR